MQPQDVMQAQKHGIVYEGAITGSAIVFCCLQQATA